MTGEWDAGLAARAGAFLVRSTHFAVIARLDRAIQ